MKKLASFSSFGEIGLAKRLVTAFALTCALTGSLHAITVTIDSSATGLSTSKGGYTRNIANYYRGNLPLYLQVRATLSNSANSSDNWGCTSIQIGSASPIHFEHANSSYSVRTRELSGNGLKTPAANGVYKVIIRLYSGSKIGGVCNGSLIKTDNPFAIMVSDLGTIHKDMPVAPRFSTNIYGDMKVIGNTSLCVPQVDLGDEGTTDTYGSYYYGTYGTYNRTRHFISSPESPCLEPQFTRHPDILIEEADNMLYAYVKDDGTVTGSINQSNTMAMLYHLPPKAKIVKAKLYWIGRVPYVARPIFEDLRLIRPYHYPNNGAKGSLNGCAKDPEGRYVNNDDNTDRACDGVSGENRAKMVMNEFANTGVKLKVPGRDYETVHPEKIYYTYAEDTHNYMMQADVTHLINPNQQEGAYYVKGVPTILHAWPYGTYAGWMLAVIYENSNDPNETLKYVTFFDGYVANDRGRQDYPIPNYSFRTPPRGDVDTKLFYMVGQGHQTDLGDCFMFNYVGNPTSCNNDLTRSEYSPPYPKSKAVYIGGRGGDGYVGSWKDNRPDANAFSSSITVNGTPTPGDASSWGYPNKAFGTPGFKPIGSKPDWSYTQGYDLHTYNLHNVLGNNQTGVNLRMFASMDYYYMGFLAFSTTIYAPHIPEVVQEGTFGPCQSSQSLAGRRLDYTLTFYNRGNEEANGIVLTADFDEGGLLQYIDHDQTTIDGVYRVGSNYKLPASAVSCSKTAWSVECKFRDSYRIGVGDGYVMKYSVVFNSNVASGNTTDVYWSYAYLTYHNAVSGELIKKPAVVKDPYYIQADDCYAPICTDSKLAKPVIGYPRTNKGSGLYVLKPAQSVYSDGRNPFNEPMLVYCDLEDYNAGDKNSSKIKIWLPLPMSQKGEVNRPINSNFAFASFYKQGSKNFSNAYYHPKHVREPFPEIMKGKVKNSSTGNWEWSAKGDPIYGLRLDLEMLDRIGFHRSMYTKTFPTFSAGASLSQDARGLAAHNINLTGTSLSFAMQYGGCYDPASPASFDYIQDPLVASGHFGQVYRQMPTGRGEACFLAYDPNKTLNWKGGSVPAASYLVQLGSEGSLGANKPYKYMEPRNGRQFFYSCRDIQQSYPSAQDGFYLIDPLDNQGVPFVAYCNMPKKGIGRSKEEMITTSFLALDGDIVRSSADVAKDTCVKKGLSPFVPTSKELFENMRTRLNEDKLYKWQRYMPTNNGWYMQMSGGESAFSGSFYIPSLKDKALWPYGSFGLYKGSGANAGAWSRLDAGKALHYIDGDPSTGNTLLYHYGWKTVFDKNGTGSANAAIGSMFSRMIAKDSSLAGLKLEPTYWLSDGGCSYGGYNEPSGNYDAHTWLNYMFDDNGNVMHCDDSNNKTLFGMGEYSYANYACIGLDSYFPLRNAVVPKEAGAWDVTLDPTSDAPATFTKIAALRKADINIKIAPTDVTNYSGLLCARLVAANFDGTFSRYKPSGATNPNANAIALSPDSRDDYKCASIADTQNLLTDPLTFSWNYDLKASTNVVVEVLMSNCATIAEIGSGACETHDFNASRFSLRPAFSGGAYKDTLIAGAPYSDAPNPSTKPPTIAFPNGGVSASATAGYKRESGVRPCKAVFGLCIQAIDEKIGDVSSDIDANITFSGVSPNKAIVNKLSYDDVGKITLYLLDKNWTQIDQDIDATAVYGAAFRDARWKNDCEVGGDSNEANLTGNKYTNINYGKIGCDIKQKIAELKIVPHKLQIDSLAIIGPFEKKYSNDSSFVYYANENDGALERRQFARVIVSASARNAKGNVTGKYSDGNYSQDINHSIGFMNSKSQSVDMPQSVAKDENGGDRFWTYYFDGADFNKTTPASAWKEGRADITYAFNFGRKHNQANPVFFMKAKSSDYDFNLSLKDTDDVIGDGYWATSGAGDFKEISFIYGRANVLDVLTYDQEANVTFTIDYFSDRGSNGIRNAFRSPSISASSAGWYALNALADTNTEANVTANIKGYAEQGTPPSIKNANSAIFIYPLNERRPRRFVSHLNMPSYLWYHPFGKTYKTVVSGEEETRKGCFEHPCGTIEFVAHSKDEWGGIGNRNDHRHYDDNSTREHIPFRLGR
ncbi:MAG: hypothetical protein LBQ52_09265 [Helicobacteraceae bacterium]|jgi:hypothetical protein|nr:hypothetical protein [Helicobacteraceae bacterium]